jgi:DNA-binding winged helix-turn-helix (wHTH) protein
MQETYEFGPFRVDLRRRVLERDGAPIALSGKAFEILVALLEQRGEILDKDTLMKAVWPDTIVEENNLTVNISWLRKALGETPQAAQYILTIPGRGYRFIGEITNAESPAARRPRRLKSFRLIYGAVAGVTVLVEELVHLQHGVLVGTGPFPRAGCDALLSGRIGIVELYARPVRVELVKCPK